MSQYCYRKATAIFFMGVLALSAQTVFAATGTWTPAASIGTGRQEHTATLLANGKVLVVGGFTGTHLNTADLYDPATNSWSSAGNIATARSSHTATLLPNGKVLIAGGQGNSVNGLSSAELYDPATNTWSAAGSLSQGRGTHTATLLLNGKVLVAGGHINSTILNSAELYDPAANTWSAAGALNAARDSFPATLLPNGKVLVAGGTDGSFLSSAELYDPGANTWSTVASLAAARALPSATLLANGKVLVAAGFDGGGVLNSAELYNPGSNTWSAAGSLSTARREFCASLMPNGKVLVAGGDNGVGSVFTSAEIFDPVGNTWSSAASLSTARAIHTATLLPSGLVLVISGSNSGGLVATTEIFDYAGGGSWSATGSMASAREAPSLLLLTDGKVLCAGGFDNTGGPLYPTSTEIFDPAAGTWSSTGSLTAGRAECTITQLPNGKILIAGGHDAGALASAELYDPAAGTWSVTGSMGTARYFHSATLLPNGKVLVAGGGGASSTATCELYDPSSGTWSATGSLGAAYGPRFQAVLLPNGKVLVAGNTSEIYDPGSGTWTATTGNLATSRTDATLTLLANGKVLIAAGYAGGEIASAELFDPGTGTWSATGSLTAARSRPTGVLLPTGKVLLAGGSSGGGNFIATSELYDPASGTWSNAGSMTVVRSNHRAVLLQNSRVLVAGGDDIGPVSRASAELYDVGLGFAPSSQPVLSGVTNPLLLGAKLAASGTRFKGISEASGGGFQNSATNFPLLQLRSLVNDQVAFLHADPANNWSDTLFTSKPVSGFPPGYALVTVFTNGIPSNSKIITISNSSGITSSLSASGTYGTAFSYNITASNSPTSYNASGLPSGLSVNTSNGLVSGTPGASGTFIVNISATGTGTVSATLTLTIAKATPIITWSNPAGITYPVALGGTQLNASSATAGGFSYTPASGTVLNAGNGQTLSVTLTPTDTANYNNASASVTINVAKGTPTVSWSNPADITFGVALSATQLNATANTVGAFVYTPASGTVLNAGNSQSLSVQFTPNDTPNWNTPPAATVLINVVTTVTSLSVSPNPVEPGKTVTFSLGGGGGQTITWDFGDGSPLISGSSVTHVYSSTGTFTVTVTLSNGTTSTTQTVDVEVSNVNSRVIGNFVIAPNPAGAGDQITFTATANANAGGQINFTWSFGDGTDSGKVTDPTNSVTTKHTYAQIGDYPVVLTARDGTGKLIGTASQTAFIVAPGTAHGGAGTKLTNTFDGVAIQIADKVAGIVALDVQVLAPNRDAFEVGTDFGVTGRSTAVKGTRPVHKYEKSGLYVATSRAFDIDTGSEQGKMRKTIPISRADAGENALVKNPPADQGIKVSGIKGKFSFAKLIQDAVAFGASVELPEGFDVRREHEFSVAIGNVVDNVTLTNRGAAASQGANFSILKLTVKYPKLAKGTFKTSAGQKASISLLMAANDLATAGFDTEGITPTLAADEATQKTVNRNIQIAIMIDGVTYESLQQVQYKVAKNTGQISGRSSK